MVIYMKKSRAFIIVLVAIFLIPLNIFLILSMY